MGYRDNDDDDEETFHSSSHNSGRTRNDFSGSSHNSVQARDVQGDINFHVGDRTETWPGMHFGFTAAVYGLLFVVASAVTHTITAVDLGFWDWVKLVASTIIFVVVFIKTEYRLQGAAFYAFRRLCAVLVIALAVNQGANWPGIADLVNLLSDWLIWRF